MSHVIRKKNMLQVAGILCVEIAESNNRTFLKEAAMNKAQVVSCTWTACQVSFKRVFHATVLEAVLGSASSCWKWCCAWRKSWIARKYPCFIFNIPVWRGEFQKKHVAPWRPCTTSAFSAAWHQQAQSQIRFYKRFGSLMYMACKLMDNIFWKWYGSSFAS